MIFKFNILLGSKRRYFEQYKILLNQSKSSSSGFKITTPDNIKVIAFYLPQFHPIDENNKNWCPGFTEWTNVTKAMPQFIGHNQPKRPNELGFYDLRIPEILEKQVSKAREIGIKGFCFHYYWFGGRKIMDMPINSFISNTDINFPFCICWANENWTRRWDGMENEVLIEQNHSYETDKNFIVDILPYISNRNYITFNSRPIIIIYRVDIIPNLEKVIQFWKSFCLTNGINEPYIIGSQTFGFTNPTEKKLDAAVQFPPHNINFLKRNYRYKLLNPNFKGGIYDYRDMVDAYSENLNKSNNLFPCVSPGWDNTPRKNERASIFVNNSKALFYKWIHSAVMQQSKSNEGIVFINSWNEWAEGSYLE